MHFRFFIKKTLQLPSDKVYIKDHLSVLLLAKFGGFRRLWKGLKEIKDASHPHPCLTSTFTYNVMQLESDGGIIALVLL